MIQDKVRQLSFYLLNWNERMEWPFPYELKN